MYKAILLFSITFFVKTAIAQSIINGYAQVTNIAGFKMDIGNVDETADAFQAGDRVILMQMQGASVGSNTANNASFGSLSTIQNAGKYEEVRIQSLTRNGSGVLTSLDFISPLLNTYDVTGSVQIITYKTYIGNYTTASDMTCKAWNGSIGGVLAFRVIGNLILQHNLTVDGKGFVGGTPNINNNFSACDAINYVIAPDNRHAFRGRGISNEVFPLAGRGKLVNAGGGGNDINAGGGGGGGYTAGGLGGPGWDNSAVLGCNPNAGGQGGESLSTYMAPAQNRLFMGGSGGGGHQNDFAGSVGGNGGGIILIKAYSFVTLGTCTLKTISANGSDVISGTNDGQGGAGAGGSIFLDFLGASAASTCPVVIKANGGTGGTVLSGSTHGGGGGGGQGAIYNTLASSMYGSGVTFETKNGLGGANNNSLNYYAENGNGANDAGIFFSGGTILPLQFLDLKVQLVQGESVLQFETLNELNVSHLIVQHSIDNMNWNQLGVLGAKGASRYHFTHPFPASVNYYRILVVDKDGGKQFSNIVLLNKQKQNTLTVLPNPTSHFIQIQSNQLIKKGRIQIVNAMGQVQLAHAIQDFSAGRLNVASLANGHYFLLLNDGKHVITEKIIVMH
jgi:hypothetical protein